MSQNIKNNLFRFVTLRSPQLIDEKDKQLGFVYHPESGGGEFLTAVDAASEGQKKQALLDTRDSFATTGTPFITKADVKGVNENLYNFSSWLMRNKNTLSYAEILDNITGVTELSNSDEIKLWDNLIYQTINKTSVYVREALIKMLIANKFLLHFKDFADGLSGEITFTEDQEKEFIRCANASVVISKKLLLETYNEISSNSNIKGVSAEKQKRLSDLLSVKYDKVALEKLTSELKELKKTYTEQEEASYKTALENHQKDVETILDAGNVELVQKWDIERQAYIQVESLVHTTLPKFNYTKATEIDSQELQTALSSLSYKYLTDNKLDTLTSYDAILQAIKHISKEKANKIEQLLPRKGKTVQKNGVTMLVEDPFGEVLTNFGDVDGQTTQMVEDEVPLDLIPLYTASEIYPFQIDKSACYTINVVGYGSTIIEDNRHWRFVVGVTHSDEVPSIASVTQSLSFTNDATVITSTDFEVSNTLANHSKIRLFNDLGTIPKTLGVGNPILTVTVTLTNGTQLDFSETIEVSPNLRTLMGTKILNFDCNDEEDVPEETPSTFGKIYGVTNLGIADFRRVEQEVCCYVPGEVSHIENVMAREYKERSTRSLTSSEFTTEQTDEQERENLTDTTSTERNEMQSEVASVLNEDQSQSYGGNVGVSSEFGGTRLSAGAYFDNASSSSSSNSNSQAQTYAQEVTERAMERIVQKTQTKRTSRILKEFEENNSHGFDNRKGTEHVTGVYRWVDKIYKNKLINYGKRLMYEFAIPEPSKFFQEAVWKAIDKTGQVESGVILPEPPIYPDMIIASIDDINEVNYLQLAKSYGIELPKYPEQEMYIGKAYGFSAAVVESNNHERYGEGTELEIPEGYYATEATAEWTHSHDNSVSDPVKAIVGNERITSNGVYVSVNRFTNNIPLSYSARTVLSGSVNFSIRILRSEEYFDKWKNEVYRLAIEAYYDRLQEYNDAIREKEANSGLTADEEKLSFNPLENKSIMLRELKRVAIELLIDKDRISRNNFGDMDEATGVSRVNKGEAFQTHASTVKFFEQAFDWDIMAYVFYPYFYAAEGDWKKLFQLQDAADPLFQAFLQSGMARTVVPVRPGFEDAVNWYMATGEIWNGQGMVIDQDDDLYVSVAEEMQTVQGEVEGTWETRLPTALTILQAGSIGLNVEGLPCNTDCDDNLLFDTDGEPIFNEDGTQQSANPIEQTDTLIGGEEGPSGVGSDSVGEVITVQ